MRAFNWLMVRIMAVVGVLLLCLYRCPICAAKLDGWHLFLYFCPNGCRMAWS